MKDGVGSYYAVLGVPHDADEAAIRKAYRKLATKRHPDRGGAAGAMEALQDAYECLIDPVKRAAYDAGDDSTAADMQATAEEVLQSYARAFIESEFAPRNLKAALARRISADAEAFAHGLAELRDAQIECRKWRVRMRRKTEGVNVFTTLFEERQAELVVDINEAMRGAEVVRLALAMLDDYFDTGETAGDGNEQLGFTRTMT